MESQSRNWTIYFETTLFHSSITNQITKNVSNYFLKICILPAGPEIPSPFTLPVFISSPFFPGFPVSPIASMFKRLAVALQEPHRCSLLHFDHPSPALTISYSIAFVVSCSAEWLLLSLPSPCNGFFHFHRKHKAWNSLRICVQTLLSSSGSALAEIIFCIDKAPFWLKWKPHAVQVQCKRLENRIRVNIFHQLFLYHFCTFIRELWGRHWTQECCTGSIW